MKLFTYPELDSFKRTFLARSFDKIVVAKPEASRKDSSEIYWVFGPLPFLSRCSLRRDD
jgi:23S rRNA U2552 (ribose-2'-O)-methylase RlmE/FtsJ